MSWNKSITRAHNQSQFDRTFWRTFERQFHVTDPLVHRLKIIHEFEGHTGCVNCLDWHPSRGELISGSDDSNINIWNTQKLELKKTIKSGYNGNIFSCKYVNLTDSIASCAADKFVKVHDIETSELTFNCFCHTHRVKRLATIRNDPFVFLSAGEDGIVLHHDTRAPHNCSELISEGVLLNLNQILERTCQIKCVSINPSQPHLFVIGANDPFVRLYDRRMLSVTHAMRPTLHQQANSSSENYHRSVTHNVPFECAQYYTAAHMTDLKLKSVACTDISFNSNGTEFLANFGSEHIYLFDINKRTPEYKRYQRRIEFDRQREMDECANRPEDEQRWRREVFDMKKKFIGHANCATDIKEVKFFGRDDQYIVAGSDDGLVFFWDRSTTNITRVVRGDRSIVNCIQPHPTDCMLATSGIDKEVKLWAPKHEDGTKEEDDEPINIEKTVQNNLKFVYENLLVESFDDFGFQPNVNPLYRDPEEDDGRNSVESRRFRFFL